MSTYQHPAFTPVGSVVPDPPAPGTPEWSRLITASKIPAILGLSSWDSPYSLWCKATGRIEIEAGGAAADRGTALEGALLAWLGTVLEDSRVRPGRTFAMDAHPTWQAAPDGLVYEGRRRTPYALVECKTAARGDEWGRTSLEDPTAEIPPAYLAQVAWQMFVTGADLVYVPALVVMDLRLYVVRRADVEDALPRIVQAAGQLEGLIHSDTAPDWDGAEVTYTAARAVHAGIDPDAEASISNADAVELHAAVAAKKAAEERERLIKCRVLGATGTARTITDEDGIKVALRVPAKGGPILRLSKYEPLVLKAVA